jgi:hypothetical protein
MLGSALHVNEALTTYAIAWQAPADKRRWFARQDFFPRVPVKKDSDIIRSVSQGAMLQIYNAAVGSNGRKVPLVEFRIGPNRTFKCRPYCLEGELNQYHRRQADDALQYDKNQTNAPRWALEMSLEDVAMQTLLDPAQYGNNVTVLSSNELWDDYGSSASSIYDEIATRLEKIVLDTGELVNRIGFSFPVWRIIKGHPGLLKRPFFNQAGTSGYRLTLKDFEALFDEWVEPGACRVYRGVYNANPSPNEDDPKDLKLFWGPGMLAAYCKETADLEDLSLGKEFIFSGLDGNDPLVVMQFEDKEILPIGGERIRLMASADYRIMHHQSAWFWPQVVDKTSPLFSNEAGLPYFA